MTLRPDDMAPPATRGTRPRAGRNAVISFPRVRREDGDERLGFNAAMHGGPFDQYLFELSDELLARGRWHLDVAEWPGEYLRDPIDLYQWHWIASDGPNQTSPDGSVGQLESEALGLARMFQELAEEFTDLLPADLLNTIASEYNHYATARVRDNVLSLVAAKTRRQLREVRRFWGGVLSPRGEWPLGVDQRSSVRRG